MDIQFDWLLDVFGAFYDFFFGIGAFLEATPFIIEQNLAFYDSFSFTWENPYTNVVQEFVYNSSLIGDGIIRSLPFSDKPLWYNVLVLIPTVYIGWFVLKGIIHAIKGVVF